MGEILLLLVLALLFLAGGSVCGIAAVVQLSALRRKVGRLESALAELAREARAAGHLPALAEARQAQPREPTAAPPPTAARGGQPCQTKPPPTGAPKDRAFHPQPDARPPPAFAAEATPRDWGRLEEALGRKWTVWVGVLILLGGVGFFVMYAFEQGWISPPARVGAGLAAGLVLAGLGARFHRRKMRALGQGLMGGGLGLLYLSLFAGYNFYDALIPLPWAFGAMIAVTVLGVAWALLLDAQPICALATLGGFLTPLLLSTGQDTRDALFAYVMMLDLGVLAVAWFKGWRFLDTLALLGTAALFTGWAVRFSPVPAPAPAVAWLAGFYAVFLLVPLAHHLRRRSPVSVERFVQTWGCAAYFLGMAHWMAGPEVNPLALATLGAAAAYAGLGLLARRRIPQDRRSVHAFAALSMIFLALAPAIAWDLYGPTLAWALQAVGLVALGCLFAYLPLRIGGDALLLLAGGRLIFYHGSLPSEEFVPFATGESGVLWAVVAAGAAAAWIRRRFRENSTDWDRVARIAAANLAGLAAIIGLHRELWHWRYLAEDRRAGRWLVSLVWTAGAAAFMAGGVKLRCAVSRVAAAGALLTAMALAAVAYDFPWPEGGLPVINPRFAAAFATIAAAFAFGRIHARFKDSRGQDATPSRAMHALGVAALFFLLSAEAVAACRGLLPPTPNRGWIIQMTLSLVWAAYASGLLCFGFWRRLRPVRLAGLGFFGLTAAKVVLLDMANVEQLYRIGTFVALGLLMIGASYLYHRLERLLDKPGETGTEDSG